MKSYFFKLLKLMSQNNIFSIIYYFFVKLHYFKRTKCQSIISDVAVALIAINKNSAVSLEREYYVRSIH